MMLVMKRKLKSQESDDCIGWQNRKFSKGAGEGAPDLVDTHYICPVSLMAASMAGPLLQMS